MRRLTVMLLVNDLRIGGAERQLVELALGLDKGRYRVIVGTLYSGQPFERDLADSDVELMSLDRKGKYGFGTTFKLARFLRREKVDIIQPFLTPATTFGLGAAMLARTPVKIVTQRCGVRNNTGVGNKAYRWFEDRLTNFARIVVPNSEAGATYLSSRGVDRNKLRVIHNGVAPERISTTEAERDALRTKLGIAPENWCVGVVASLTPAKDHGTFLQAASILRAEVPGTKFLLVGDGPLRNEIHRRAGLLRIEDSVIFAGHQVDVAPYIGAMDIAMLSSNDHEGCSNFLIEAMGLGRPIVATDVGGNAELFKTGHAGTLVPPGNPLIMAHAALEIMRNPDMADDMRKQGRAVFEQRFTTPRMVAKYDDLFQWLWQQHETKHPRRERAKQESEAETVGEG